MRMARAERAPAPAGSSGWDLAEGAQIAHGRTAVRLLGSSNVHDVYAAWDDTILGIVAVKMLQPGSVDDERARAALAAEAEALDRLSHPSFPRCFDVALDGERPHIVLELVEGPRLSTLIRRQGRLGVEQALPLVLQLASAIHYIATTGILHLDVKPKNVMMSPPPRLIDLSVARTIDRARSTAYPVGTDRYMAPEQCGTGLAHEMGHATDVWGLGVTMHEALAGTRPFPDGDRPRRASAVPAARARSGAVASRRARAPRVARHRGDVAAPDRPPVRGGDRGRARSADRGHPPAAPARQGQGARVEARGATVRGASLGAHRPLTTHG